MPLRLVDLGHGKSAFLRPSGVVLYDAAARKRLAAISLRQPIAAQWSEARRLLLIETAPYYDEHRKGYQWHVHGYLVD